MVTKIVMVKTIRVSMPHIAIYIKDIKSSKDNGLCFKSFQTNLWVLLIKMDIMMESQTDACHIQLLAIAYYKVRREFALPALHVNMASLSSAAGTGGNKMTAGCGYICPEFWVFVQI